MKKNYIYNGQKTNYIITSDGKVFNEKTGRELKGTFSRNEYQTVQLTINGKPISIMVHRMVAEMFCENPNNYSIVDHIDRDKYNNEYTNLRWVDSSTNVQNRMKKDHNTEYTVLKIFEEKDWKELRNFPNYLANKNGQIINKKTKRILHGSIRNGYIRVKLEGKSYSLHRLVWEAINEEDLTDKDVIDHIDGNRLNNNISNLRKVTQKDNIINSHERGHKKDVIVHQYDSEGNYINTYQSMAAASKAVGKSKDAVRGAANRHGKCAGFYWLRSDDDTKIEDLLNKK